MATNYLGCDLGAESGRLMLGSLAKGRLVLEEIHRFPNTPIKADGSLHWNISALFDELRVGLKKVAGRNLEIASISCDSWGVDYLLFDEDGCIVTPTFHYRDSRAAKGVENAYSRIDWETIFAETGIQYMPFNTLFQLAAESPDRLRKAERLLLVGDGFNFLLSAVAKAEESLASTSQLFNPRTKAWSDRLIDALGLPRKLFPPIVPSGTSLGWLRPAIAQETGLTEIEVIATCAHDTGAAVAAVPATGENWAYLSSGTWSLMGVELPAPIITDASRALNFTNEIGYGGTIRLLKNIVGLWVVQECRRDWAKTEHDYDYSMLSKLADAASPFVSLIDPADPRFIAPDEMPAKVVSFCRETGQAVPSGPGAIIRCVLESLALLYRRTLGQLEQLLEKRVERLHIVGGGSRNSLLNRFTANALQIPVLIGPVEATAAGNILVQAIALGHLPNLTAAREVVRDSMPINLEQPSEAAVWNAAYERFEKLCQR